MIKANISFCSNSNNIQTWKPCFIKSQGTTTSVRNEQPHNSKTSIKGHMSLLTRINSATNKNDVTSISKFELYCNTKY